MMLMRKKKPKNIWHDQVNQNIEWTMSRVNIRECMIMNEARRMFKHRVVRRSILYPYPCAETALWLVSYEVRFGWVIMHIEIIPVSDWENLCRRHYCKKHLDMFHFGKGHYEWKHFGKGHYLGEHYNKGHYYLERFDRQHCYQEYLYLEPYITKFNLFYQTTTFESPSRIHV